LEGQTIPLFEALYKAPTISEEVLTAISIPLIVSQKFRHLEEDSFI